MRMKLMNEEEILSADFRAKIITEIKGTENVDRKDHSLRRLDVYKDKTRKWVIEALEREFSRETVIEMQSRVSNISICRKVVDKLARSYVQGARRETKEEASTKTIAELVVEMDFQTKMKKGDRYLELFKNTMVQVVPQEVSRESTETEKKFKIASRIHPPHKYDVIEDIHDREMPRVVILSDFVDQHQRPRDSIPSTSDGREDSHSSIFNQSQRSDQKDQVIADSPEDEGTDFRTFIWWSDRFHFTTDGNGAIIEDLSPEGNENPIGKLPFEKLAEDQDGSFWADGGDDLIDGSILINQVITDQFAIANVQGWGQMVITGKGIPPVIKGGPHKALIFEQDSKDDPEVKVQYVSSNPPLDVWMQMIEQYTALLLSTNNLSARNIAGKLDATSFPSGIADLIERSESIESVEDRQRMFKDAEPNIWEIIKLWMDLYSQKGILSESFTTIGTFNDSNVKVIFDDPKPTMTEEEKLSNIKLRKELGINTEIELLMIDDPELKKEDADEKLKKILEEKLKRRNEITKQMGEQNPPVNPPENLPNNPVAPPKGIIK